MMAEIDFLSPLHKATTRDYLARVNDPDFPKAKAAELAKQWGYDYWDGDRRICYGGYRYMPGRLSPWPAPWPRIMGLRRATCWTSAAPRLPLLELQKVVPGLEVHGLDISDYALSNAHEDCVSGLTWACQQPAWPTNISTLCTPSHPAQLHNFDWTGPA
jgi:protein-L-isoaspartate(D-aspartate) O-methyltransferase